MKARWQTKKLGELAEVQSGGTPLVSNKDYWNGDIPWYSSGELNNLYTSAPERKISPTGLERSNAKIFPTGSLLIGMYDTAALKMSILDRPGAFNQAIAGVKPNSKIDVLFVLHAINSAKEHILGQRRGVRQKNLSLGKVRNIELTLPALPEQKRIAALLEEAFDGIGIAKINTEKNIQNARTLFESRLQALFTQSGKGWVEKKLGEELDLLAGFAFKSAQYSDSEDSVRLLRGDNIVQSALRWKDVKRWPASNASEYSRYQLREGDIVLAMDRPWVKAGLKHAMISALDLPCLLVQRTARLRCGPEIDNRFLMYLIGGSEFTNHILGVQSGIGVPHISGQQIENFIFLRPPLAKQRCIADVLDSFREETQRLASIYQQKLAALDELKKSLLDQAFTGQL